MAVLVAIGVAQLVVLARLLLAISALSAELRQAWAEQQLHSLERQTIDALFSAARQSSADVIPGRAYE